MTIYCFLYIIVYINNSEIHVLNFFSSVLFLKFIESILENVNDVVCLSLLSNTSDIEIFYDNDNDTIEKLIYFAVMEDKTIINNNYYNLKHQVADNISK